MSARKVGQLRWRNYALVAITLLLGTGMTRAGFDATSFTFDQQVSTTSNNGSAYTVTIFDYDANNNALASNQVRARFAVANGGVGQISNVYTQDGTYFDALSASNLTASSGVSFAVGATPSNLPGGNSVSPNFVATQNLSASDTGNNSTAIGANEWLDITFTLINNNTYSSIIGAITGDQPNSNGDFLRFGIQVQNAVGGNSAEYINGKTGTVLPPPSDQNPVPAPPTAILALLGLPGFAAAAWARRRKFAVA